ncbi:MAG TPA: hypothetical protein PLH38_07180 [Clostridia bacterium]|nr:hypothetical protein [Clostridia bacterium]
MKSIWDWFFNEKGEDGLTPSGRTMLVVATWLVMNFFEKRKQAKLKARLQLEQEHIADQAEQD